jgi:hypothetical protein
VNKDQLKCLDDSLFSPCHLYDNDIHEKISQFWLAKNSAMFSKYSAKKFFYSANFIDSKIQPFLAENNTKNQNIYKWQKWLAFLVDVLLKLLLRRAYPEGALKC